MKTVLTKTLFLIFCVLCLPGPAVCHGTEIRLSVAASMRDVVKELTAAYTVENPHVTLFINVGSSGALAKQITQGAPADLFLSANVRWMDYLVKKNKIDQQSVRFFASNSLVLVGSPKALVGTLEQVPSSLSRVAIGSPRSVPAGQYAEQAMRSAAIYDHLLAEKKLVMAKDVRQALLYAERGEVDGAFVYKTDSLLAKQAAILLPVPANLHERIDYPAGLTRQGSANPAARSLNTFLTSPLAVTILQKFGFAVPSAAPTAANTKFRTGGGG